MNRGKRCIEKIFGGKSSQSKQVIRDIKWTSGFLISVIESLMKTKGKRIL